MQCSFARIIGWRLGFAVSLLTNLAFADGAALNQGPAPHGGPEHAVGRAVEAPSGWHRSPGGVITPGPGTPTLADQILAKKNAYVPGQPPQPRGKVELVIPGGAPPKRAPKILPASPPGDPSRLAVVSGSGARAVAEALEAHGAFKEARTVYGRPTSEKIPRAMPDSMRQGAADLSELSAKGMKRAVAAYVPPPDPKTRYERVRRVFEYFFKNGEMPGAGELLRIEGSPPSEDPVANQIYDNTGTVYSFYKTVLGRMSIDDRGRPILSAVHQSDMDRNGELRSMSNAFYREDDTIEFGDGNPNGHTNFTSLDVTGHELTHGVTAHTARLVFRGQSGALNESFSDVLGMAIRQWKQGVTVNQADWRLGVDVPSLTAPRTVGPIRSFSDPASVGNQPAHMSQFKVMTADAGGVHVNSGIPNRAFYGAAMRIGGYVWEKSAKIWYVALRDYLRPNATFLDAARATTHVAGELYGVGSREQAAVIAGWRDVGIRVDAKDPVLPRTASRN